MLPDIDLDFPRAIRDELVRRVHERFGQEFAVLTGAIATYSVKGVVQDLGKALGLPKDDLKLLSRQVRSLDAADLRDEMLCLPAFRDRVGAPGWRDLVELAPQLMHAPRSLGQHVGGMVLSDSPIPEMVPVRAGAIDGRFIMDWNKDSVADANFAKIDLLDMISEGRSKGVCLLQSPAQLKMGQRLRSRNLLDLAYQVALIRPGVGVQGSAVSRFVERYRHGVPWDYDHSLEKRALERGYGVIVWQEQVVQLLVDVAGMTAAGADEVRRAFARPNNEHLIAMHWERFRQGAAGNGVPEEAARKIFAKINGHYMFPESHSHAFAVTAYQAAWLKRHHPVKEDARRFGIPFLNPCVNRSGARCIPSGDAVLLGLRSVKDVGVESASALVREREEHGLYRSAADLVRRTGLKPQAVLSLVMAGAFDGVTPNRREALWDAGLGIRPAKNGQRAFALAESGDTPAFADLTEEEKMMGEYRVMGIYPKGHVMEFVRPRLRPEVLPAAALETAPEGEEVLVAGWPVARQHPRGKSGTVFVTVEDETGDAQLILWPRVFARFRRELESRLVVAHGAVSRWDGTTNVIVSQLERLATRAPLPSAHDWR